MATMMNSTEDIHELEAHVRVIIKCIVTIAKVKMTVSKLCKEFFKHEGTNIPWRAMRFNSLTHFIKSLDNVITLDPETDLLTLTGHPQSKSAHVRNLIRNSVSAKRYNRGGLSCTFVDHKKQMEIIKIVNGSPGILFFDLEVAVNKKFGEPLGNMDEVIHKIDHIVFIRSKGLWPNLSAFPQEIQDYGKNPGAEEPSSKGLNLMTTMMIENLVKLLRNYPQGVWCYDLPTFYKIITGSTLAFCQLGYVSLVVMLMGSPHLFRCERLEGDWRIYDMQAAYPPVQEVLAEEVLKVRHLLGEVYREGVWLKHFEATYQEQFGDVFCFKAMRYSSLKEALQTLHNENIHLVNVCSESVVKIGCPDINIQRIRPSGVIFSPKDVIPTLVIDPEILAGKTSEIRVQNILGPHIFFIQLTSDFRAITEMFDKIRTYYECNTRYIIPSNMIKKGLYCVVKNVEFSHRAIVASTVVDGFVSVMLIDLGRIHHASVTELNFMMREFAKLPCQGILCMLHGIKPVGSDTEFSAECCRQFTDLVADKYVMATVYSYVDEQMSMSVVVETIDENNDRVDVNEELVAKKLAVEGPFENDPNCRQITIWNETISFVKARMPTD